MKIRTAAREYLIEIEVRKFTPKTIRSYRNNRSLFLRYCETEAQITQDLLSAKAIPATIPPWAGQTVTSRFPDASFNKIPCAIKLPPS